MPTGGNTGIMLMGDITAYPGVSKGQVALLPLKRAGEEWRFVFEEAVGLVVPAIAHPAPTAPTTASSTMPAISGEEFIARELAQGLAASPAKARESVMYLDGLGTWGSAEMGSADVARIIPLLDPLVVRPEAAFALAANCYSALYNTRPNLATLLRGEAEPAPLPDHGRPSAATRALLEHLLDRAGKEKLRERFLAATLELAGENPEGVARTLAGTFWDEPTALAAVEAWLKANKADALEPARRIIRAGNTSLTVPAIARALTIVEAPSSSMLDQRAAADILTHEGAAADFTRLVNAIKAMRAKDDARARDLWIHACYSGGTTKERRITLYALDLDDTTRDSYVPKVTGPRRCDVAVRLIAEETGQDFGFVEKASEAERDAAVARARKYLAEHAP